MKRLNFHGNLISIATNINPPWMFGNVNNDLTLEPTDGMSYRFLLFMAEYFNFTYKLIDHNGDYGYHEVSDLNYTGLMKSVISGETRFAMGGISVRMAHDNPFVRMSDEVKTSRITYMTLDSEPINVKGVIFRPFDLLQRGTRHLPNGYGSNFLIQISWYTGLFMMVFYSNEIISSLTNLQSKRNIATLNEFCDKIMEESVVPLVVKGTTLRSFFMEHRKENEIYDILSQNMEIISNSMDGIYRMVESRLQRRFKPTKIYAILGSFDTLDMLANRFGNEHFNYADTIASSILTDRYGLLFSNNSTLTSFFNECIRIAQAHGFFAKWHRKNYKLPFSENPIDTMLNQLEHDHNVGFTGAKESNQILHMKNVAECFILYICCIAITIMIFITEILLKYLKVSKPLMKKILLKRLRKQEKLEHMNSQEEIILPKNVIPYPDITDSISGMNQKQVALHCLLRRRGSQNL
ncbi:uncharacterized protein LOC124494539 isoform X3 [Dermatophagoides farinae]|uniref:uncharacterized protein LOC124494539 isoform X3 n=1 Tax=Dermatophagoides farinae TaxID=6954 RepID=UPI003F604893